MIIHENNTVVIQIWGMCTNTHKELKSLEKKYKKKLFKLVKTHEFKTSKNIRILNVSKATPQTNRNVNRTPCM